MLARIILVLKLLYFGAHKQHNFVSFELNAQYRVWSDHKAHITFVKKELTQMYCDLVVLVAHIVTTIFVQKLVTFPDSTLDYYFHFVVLSSAQVQVLSS